MSTDSKSHNENLIKRKDFIVAMIKFRLFRRKALKEGVEGFNRIEEKNETWGTLIEENAQKYPNNMCLKSEETNLTYREYNESVNRYANYFISQGLKKGDTAIVILENRPELLIVYSAIAKIGATNSMINTNLRESSLLHCLNLNPGNILVIGEEVIDAFQDVKSGLAPVDRQKLFFVRDRSSTAPEGFTDLLEAVKDSPVENPPTTKEVTPRDIIAYVFTSGTTGGMPKAAVITQKRAVSTMHFVGKTVLNIKARDTIYVPLPFFHTNALALSWPSIFAEGASLAIRRKFSVSNFWDDVRKYHATAFCYVGELCRYMMNQPPQKTDRKNPLKTVFGNGMRPDIWKDFKRRFGISRVHEHYGAAEANIFFVNILNLDNTVGTCFTPYAIVKYDIEEGRPIRDENGFMQRIDTSEAGLLLSEISDANPFVGYTKRDATDAKVLHDVFRKNDRWFNTGDLIRDIGYNHAQFVDRLGDTFRWKEENVSTTEVEEIANRFPQISVSTVYGVEMPGSDGRGGMAAILTTTTAEDFDFTGLVEHFQKALPSYAIPKFIRYKAEFESTATYKIKKFVAQKEGFDPHEVADPLYVLLPGESSYKPLTADIYGDIMSGKYLF
jgi:citronellyl-CoA synthetase